MKYMRSMWLLVCGCWMAGAMAAHATLAAYEGFDVTPGPGALSNASGATSFGWTNTWTTSVVLNDVRASSLAYNNGGSLTTVGGAAQLTGAGTNGVSFRHFAVPYSTSTGTYWVSFIAIVSNSSSYAGLSICNVNNEMLFLGDTSGGTNWGAQAFGTGGGTSNSTLSVTNAAFIVARVDYNVSGALDDARIWINPSLSASAPSDASAAISFQGVDFSGAGSATRTQIIRLQQGVSATNGIFDEIRVGTTWQDVAPYTSSYTPPNPAGFSAMSLSAGQLQFSVTNLTLGATNDLQRSYDLLGGLWETATTFVATTTTSNLTDAVGSSNAVLYRVSSY